MHAQRDIVLQIPSVCPSNAGIVYRRMHLVIVTLYDGIAAASLVFLWTPMLLQNSNWNPFSEGVNYTHWSHWVGNRNRLITLRKFQLNYNYLINLSVTLTCWNSQLQLL